MTLSGLKRALFGSVKYTDEKPRGWDHHCVYCQRGGPYPHRLTYRIRH